MCQLPVAHTEMFSCFYFIDAEQNMKQLSNVLHYVIFRVSDLCNSVTEVIQLTKSNIDTCVGAPNTTHKIIIFCKCKQNIATKLTNHEKGYSMVDLWCYFVFV